MILKNCTKVYGKVVALLGLGLAPLQPVWAQVYSAAWEESRWTVSSGPFQCRLSHPIPGYGEASLGRKTGQAEQLELRPRGAPGFSGSVSYGAQPMPWRSEQSPRQFGQLTVQQGVVRVGAAEVAPLLEQLRQGLQLVFSDSDRQVNVLPRQFDSAYQRYRQCVQQMIPHTFDQLARITLHYSAEAQALNGKAKTELDKVARYARADKQVLGILIDAHSDLRDSPELGLTTSRLQAELVASYLSTKGIAPEVMASRWHGDQYPVASNDQEAGRAQNRRITLRLENAGTRAQMEQRVQVMHAKAEVERQAQEAQRQAEEARQLDEEARQLERAEQTQQRAQATATQRTSATPATRRTAAPEEQVGEGFTLKDLERLVEEQDLRRGR